MLTRASTGNGTSIATSRSKQNGTGQTADPVEADHEGYASFAAYSASSSDRRTVRSRA
jgi:hypothetical protein